LASYTFATVPYHGISLNTPIAKLVFWQTKAGIILSYTRLHPVIKFWSRSNAKHIFIKTATNSGIRYPRMFLRPAEDYEVCEKVKEVTFMKLHAFLLFSWETF
jgi:hypothetical protein